MVAGDQHPILLAGLDQDHLVVSASEIYFPYVHRVVPGCLPVRTDPVGDVLIKQEPHAGRKTGR